MTKIEAWVHFAAASLSNPKVAKPDDAMAEADYMMLGLADRFPEKKAES